MLRFLLLFALLPACRVDPPKEVDSGEPADTDTDTDTDTTIDCDTSNADVHPGAEELCNGIDDNCDGVIDEGVENPYYADVDGDGFGDAAVQEVACEWPSGFVQNAEDCDDTEPLAFPGNVEVCDEVDNDCDGAVDAGVTSTFYADADADGYGDPAAPTPACEAPAGTVSNADDCDDADAAVYAATPEVYDGLDNDCDGTVDDGLDGADCADILAVYPTSTDGTYTIDPDGSGGSAAFSVLCEMDVDGGGWTQALPTYLAFLSTSADRRYLYNYGAAWYESPVTPLVWDWSSYQPLDGDYVYATSGTTAMGSFACIHAESGHWGVGCSNGGGSTYKVLPIYASSATDATSTICQDQPDAFGAGAGACQSGASIWSREE